MEKACIYAALLEQILGEFLCYFRMKAAVDPFGDTLGISWTFLFQRLVAQPCTPPLIKPHNWPTFGHFFRWFSNTFYTDKSIRLCQQSNGLGQHAIQRNLDPIK